MNRAPRVPLRSRRVTTLVGLSSMALMTACGQGRQERSGSDQEGPLYAVATTVVTADNLTSYLTTTASLDSDSALDLSHAVELPASGTFFGSPGSPFIYTASYDEPTIVRWEISSDGHFAQRETLSFLNLGMTSAWTAASAPLYGTDKSYFVSDETGEVIIWNPSAMELIGTIPLPLEAAGDLVAVPDRRVVAVGQQIFITADWQDPNDWTRFGGSTRLFVIDTATDTIADTSDEDRCNFLVPSSVKSDGTAYFSADSFYVPLRAFLGDEHGADSCGLRVVRQGTRFDEDYEIDLASLTGGRPTGDFLLLGDDLALLRAWHEDLVTPATADNWDEVRAEAGYLWWRWDLESPSAELVPDQQPGSIDTLVFRVDDRSFVTRFAEDGSKTTLLEIGRDGVLTPSLSGPGYIEGVVRVR